MEGKPRTRKQVEAPLAVSGESPAPLFTVERREVIGMVYEDQTDDRHLTPIEAGFMIAAEYLDTTSDTAECEFTYNHYTFTASVKPAS